MLSKALIVLAFLVGATLKVEASPVNKLYVDYQTYLCLEGASIYLLDSHELSRVQSACLEFLLNFDETDEGQLDALKIFAERIGKSVEKKEQWRLLEKDHE